MHDIVIIISVLSLVGAPVALGIATWHTWRLEWLRHHGDRNP